MFSGGCALAGVGLIVVGGPVGIIIGGACISAGISGGINTG